jgi:ABC-2 type transport system ATP-binding protein
MENYIEIREFYKNYGKIEAIKGITFNVAKGDFFCLVGKNGAGKTTTLRTLLNFIYPTQGILKINEMDCAKDSQKIKKFTGYLSGENYSYNYMKVKEIFKFVKEVEEIDSNRYKNELDKLVDYFEIDMNKKFSSLSHGNKRKVLIVSSLLKDPELLIYDEPTAGLDIVMRKKLILY